MTLLINNEKHGSLGQWVKTHKSILFLVTLFLLSITLLIASSYCLKSKSTHIILLGTILSQFASVGIAACTVAIFLSFQDVRNSFIATVSHMMFEGGIFKRFSEKTRRTLKKELMSSELSETLESIEEGLYAHLNKIEYQCMKSPIMLNYHESITLSPYQDNDNLLVESDVISFQFCASHFKDKIAKIDYVFCFAIANPENVSLDQLKSIFNFSARFGTQELEIDDLSFEDYMFGSYPMVLCKIKTSLVIRDVLEVRISLNSLTPKIDSTEIIYVRYPCHGFTVSFHYLPGLLYDYAWFAQWTNLTSSLPKLGEAQTDPSGISVTTNDWLLPGEGVALSWYPIIREQE